jgi:hypothetical protein
MRRLLPCIILLVCALSTSAQDDPEYKLEVGAGAGLINYLGDFNASLMSEMQPTGSLIAKYRPNPRMAWAALISYGQLKGSPSGTKTWYPSMPLTTDPEKQLVRADYSSFSNPLIDVGLRFEYNFWPYGTGREYRGARRVAPFIAIGLGATYVDATKGVFTANLPLAAGVKCKIATRWNLSVEWAMHFTASDELDGVKDPYGITSSGLFKNTDCYNVLRLAITYDLWAKCKTCNNDRD